MKLRTFIVSGSGEFPFDMLRYDSCWPATEGDSALLSPRNLAYRSVTLETVSTFQTTPERWKSFLWDVICDEAQRVQHKRKRPRLVI